MTTNVRAFEPSSAFKISVSNVSASAAIPGGSELNPNVRLYNALTVALFFAVGDSTIAATTNDYALPPGAVEVFNFGSATHIAAITTGANTGTLYGASGYRGI